MVSQIRMYVLYHQRYYNKFTQDYKPVESNWEEKSVEKATAEKRFLTLLKTQLINQKYCFIIRDLGIKLIICM